MSIFLLFFVEIVTMRFAKFERAPGQEVELVKHASDDKTKMGNHEEQAMVTRSPRTDPEHGHGGFNPDSYAAQMTAIFILELGVIFHSVFIGLTLAVAGKEFITLFVVLVFPMPGKEETLVVLLQSLNVLTLLV